MAADSHFAAIFLETSSDSSKQCVKAAIYLIFAKQLLTYVPSGFGTG